MEREDIENSLKVLSHIVDDDFIVTVDEARKIIGIDGETIEVLQAKIERLQAQLPKRGEWIVTTETSDDGAVSQHINCSVCGFYWREPKHGKVFKRCPNCGAEMEVQE